MTSNLIPPKRTGNWHQDFAAWQAWAQYVDERVRRVNDMRIDRAYKLAATVGIPRDACCLHNASIDDAMTGWCHEHPQRLKVAKRAVHIVNQWFNADKAIMRHYPRESV